MNQTVLDALFADHTLPAAARPITVSEDELVHVVGAQEPVRDQPDDRARALLGAGWLAVELIDPGCPEPERGAVVTALQQAARAWLKQTTEATPADKEQVRWLVEKTRSHESKQLIAQRVWLALVIYSLGLRGLRFDADGRIWWDEGHTARIGVSPDDVLDTAWAQPSRATYTASFRQPDGTITRGKGRNRWHTYRLTIAPEAAFLFERRAQVERQSIALIVASETFGSQPLLPRDFYGGDAFQQACIDAQDQQFAHILVLSPEHGVISLDDTVPSERLWDDVLDWNIWAWQVKAVQRLGATLVGRAAVEAASRRDVNWWAWLNPASVYEFVVFGSGFPVDLLFDYLLRLRERAPDRWPAIVLRDRRPGYDAGEIDEPFDMAGPQDLEAEDEERYEVDLNDVGQLMAWAEEFVTLVNITLPASGEMLTLEPDEALVPVRLLAQSVMDIEDLLDLLADMSLLVEQPLPISMVINAPTLVSALLQVAHSLIHDERNAIPEILDMMPEGVLHHYVESVLQEPTLEDQLCGCLTLAEQAQLLAMSVPQEIVHHLTTWLQTYLAGRLRRDILDDLADPAGR